MQGNESLFPSFSGFWFSLLLLLSAKQGWRNWHATTNHCCTFAFDPWKAPRKTVIAYPALTYHMQEGNLVWIKALGLLKVMYPWASGSWQHLYWLTSWLVVVVVVGFSSGYVAPKGWKVICAIWEAQHDPANYENPKQFDPWHHGQVHHSFCHPIRRNLHSTAQRID